MDVDQTKYPSTARDSKPTPPSFDAAARSSHPSSKQTNPSAINSSGLSDMEADAASDFTFGKPPPAPASTSTTATRHFPSASSFPSGGSGISNSSARAYQPSHAAASSAEQSLSFHSREVPLPTSSSSSSRTATTAHKSSLLTMPLASEHNPAIRSRTQQQAHTSTPAATLPHGSGFLPPPRHISHPHYHQQAPFTPPGQQTSSIPLVKEPVPRAQKKTAASRDIGGEGSGRPQQPASWRVLSNNSQQSPSFSWKGPAAAAPFPLAEVLEIDDGENEAEAAAAEQPHQKRRASSTAARSQPAGEGERKQQLPWMLEPSVELPIPGKSPDVSGRAGPGPGGGVARRISSDGDGAGQLQQTGGGEGGASMIERARQREELADISQATTARADAQLEGSERQLNAALTECLFKMERTKDEALEKVEKLVEEKGVLVHNQSVQKADMQQAKKIYTQAKARLAELKGFEEFQREADRKRKEWRTQQEHLVETLDDLRSEMEPLQQDFQTALNTDGSWFRTQRAMLETTVAALEAELEGTKRNAEARERDQNDTITLLKEDLLGKTGALTDRISRIAELEDMEKKKEELAAATTQEMMKSNNDLREHTEFLRSQLETQSQRSTVQIEELKAGLAQLQESPAPPPDVVPECARKEIADLRAQIETRNDQLADRTRELAEETGKSRALEEQTQARAKEVVEKAKLEMTLRSELEAEKTMADRGRVLEKSIVEHESKAKAVKETAALAVSDATMQVDSLREKLKSTEDSLTKIQAEKDALTVASSEQETSKSTIQELRDKLTESATMHADLEARYQDEVRNADAKVGEALLEIESLQRQLGQMKLERDQVEIKLKASEEKVASLSQDQNGRLNQTESDKLKNALESANARVTHLQSELESAQKLAQENANSGARWREKYISSEQRRRSVAERFKTKGQVLDEDETKLIGDITRVVETIHAKTTSDSLNSLKRLEMRYRSLERDKKELEAQLARLVADKRKADGGRTLVAPETYGLTSSPTEHSEDGHETKFALSEGLAKKPYNFGKGNGGSSSLTHGSMGPPPAPSSSSRLSSIDQSADQEDNDDAEIQILSTDFQDPQNDEDEEEAEGVVATQKADRVSKPTQPTPPAPSQQSQSQSRRKSAVPSSSPKEAAGAKKLRSGVVTYGASNSSASGSRRRGSGR